MQESSSNLRTPLPNSWDSILTYNLVEKKIMSKNAAEKVQL